MANKVGISVQAKGAKQAATEVTSVKTAFTRMKEEVDKNTASVAKGALIAKGAAFGFSLVGQAVGGATEFVTDSINAFREDERSQAQLRTSLRANVEAWDGNTDAIERTLKKRMQLGFQDDEQRDSLSKLAGAYGDVTKALEVQRTAMDLARYSGVDLATATDTLVKVHAGNYRALKSLGIQTKDVTDETSALAAVQKVANGQAEAYAQTLDGKLSVAQAKLNEKQEEFGKGLAELVGNIETSIVDTLDWSDAISEASRLLPGFAHGTDEQRKAVMALAHTLEQGTNDAAQYGDELIGVRHQQNAAADSADDYARSQRKLASAFDVLHESVQSQISDLEDLDRASRAQDALDALAKWKKETKNLTHEQQLLYDQLVANYTKAKLFAAITYKGVIYTGANPMGTHRVSGGPVQAGVPYTVGERGEETFIPSQNGTIVPHGATGGSPVTYAPVFNSVWPPTAAQVREMASTFGRELQRMGMLPRAGAF